MATYDKILANVAWREVPFSEKESQRLFSSDAFDVVVAYVTAGGMTPDRGKWIVRRLINGQR